MADIVPRTSSTLSDYQGDIAELGHIATCLRLMTENDSTLNRDDAAAVYWLACLAAERTDRLATAISQGGTT